MKQSIFSYLHCQEARAGVWEMTSASRLRWGGSVVKIYPGVFS
jgi:hypothetical protein